jgi:hypothetical protein
MWKRRTATFKGKRLSNPRPEWEYPIGLRRAGLRRVVFATDRRTPRRRRSAAQRPGVEPSACTVGFLRQPAPAHSKRRPIAVMLRAAEALFCVCADARACPLAAASGCAERCTSACFFCAATHTHTHTHRPRARGVRARVRACVCALRAWVDVAILQAAYDAAATFEFVFESALIGVLDLARAATPHTLACMERPTPLPRERTRLPRRRHTPWHARTPAGARRHRRLRRRRAHGRRRALRAGEHGDRRAFTPVARTRAFGATRRHALRTRLLACLFVCSFVGLFVCLLVCVGMA